MAFGLGKLAVLESKLDIYEDLSKEMLDKLERAVSTISENSNRVSIILERHESRLDEGDKSNQLIIKMIEELKATHEKDNEVLHERISQVQRKVDVNAKFVIGAGAVLATMIAILQVVPPIVEVLTSRSTTASMNRAVAHRIV